jgi:tetratricopeptide (TPR) repeat protein
LIGNTRKAVEDLERSINLAPNNSWMLWNRSVYYALSGERWKSIADLEKAILVNGNLKQRAKTDKNFQSLWNDVDFRKLVE